jgi:hypothetical protein
MQWSERSRELRSNLRTDVNTGIIAWMAESAKDRQLNAIKLLYGANCVKLFAERVLSPLKMILRTFSGFAFFNSCENFSSLNSDFCLE